MAAAMTEVKLHLLRNETGVESAPVSTEEAQEFIAEKLLLRGEGGLLLLR